MLILQDGRIKADGPREAVLASLRPSRPPATSRRARRGLGPARVNPTPLRTHLSDRVCHGHNLNCRNFSLPSNGPCPPPIWRSSPRPLALDDSGRAGRIGMWALVLGLGGFLLWAAFAPLDEGVPSQGLVAIDTKRKAVQHLTGGIVKEVLVREGDRVKEGQLLLKLDDAAARANYEAIRQRYLGLRAMQGRLLAEQAGASTIAFHPDLQSAAERSADPQPDADPGAAVPVAQVGPARRPARPCRRASRASRA